MTIIKYGDVFIKFYGWYESPGQFHLVTEYCELGDLRGYLQGCPNGRMPEDQAQEVASQVLGGLRLMHREHFAHRDIKPAVGHISIHLPFKAHGHDHADDVSQLRISSSSVFLQVAGGLSCATSD